MAKLQSKKQKTQTSIEKMQAEPQPEPETIKLSSPAEKMMTLLATQPDLRAKLLEALETDRFFITISLQKKSRPEDANDLQHYWIRQHYAVNDVLPSIRHIIGDYTAKEMPNAEIGGNDWH